MGDPARFREFATLVSKVLPLDAALIDVAGGRGGLQSALRTIGYQSVVSWDIRHKYASGRPGYHYGLFNWETAPRYDALVAMHPDEATDHAILYASLWRVPAIICPCCIKPSARPFSGPKLKWLWHIHLETLALRAGLHIKWAQLPIAGDNRVLVLTPRRY